jgi:hypothetical protein
VLDTLAKLVTQFKSGFTVTIVVCPNVNEIVNIKPTVVEHETRISGTDGLLDGAPKKVWKSKIPPVLKYSITDNIMKVNLRGYTSATIRVDDTRKLIKYNKAEIQEWVRGNSRRGRDQLYTRLSEK